MKHFIFYTFLLFVSFSDEVFRSKVYSTVAIGTTTTCTGRKRVTVLVDLLLIGVALTTSTVTCSW